MLQQLLQLSSDSVADLASCRLAANIGSTDTGLDDIADSGLDGLGVIHAAQGILHHHGNGQNGGDGVDDALACNVGGRTCTSQYTQIKSCRRYKKGRTVNRLVDTINLGLSVRNTAQARAGQETERAGDNARLITDDVAEQVAGDNDAVELPRLLNHDHGRGVNKLVLDLELGELRGHDLRHGLPPQTTSSEDVGLVQAPHGERGVVLQSQVSREPGDALNLRAGVRLRVHGVAAAVVLLALAEVDAAGQFADDVEVDAAADFGAERGAVDQRRGGEVAGAQVTECAHFLA